VHPALFDVLFGQQFLQVPIENILRLSGYFAEDLIDESGAWNLPPEGIEPPNDPVIDGQIDMGLF